MSLRDRRCRDEEYGQERALLSMRPAVLAATTAFMPGAGSSATEDAVDEALSQLVTAREHLGEPRDTKARWITYARCRLVDEQRSAEAKHRHRVTVDEHAPALALSVCGDPEAVTDERRDWWRVREILGVLHGEQRKWAEAWFRQVSGALAPGAQPRGLHEVLGWSQAKTEKTAQRARRRMASFVKQRQAGLVCAEQRVLLEGFITAGRGAGALPQDGYEAVVFHVAGCEDCFAAWHAHRRSLLGRAAPVLLAPYDSIAAAAHALADKLAGAVSGAHGVALSVQRLGIGGVAAGGGAAAISSKTAAVCATLVCAASAGVGEITGVLPPILPSAPQHERVDAARKTPKAPAPVTRSAATSPRVAAQPPPTPPVAAAKSSASAAKRGSSSATRTTATRTRSTPPPPLARTPRVTPGDLPLASNTAQTLTRSPSSAGSTTSSPSKPKCTPGDLGC